MFISNSLFFQPSAGMGLPAGAEFVGPPCPFDRLLVSAAVRSEMAKGHRAGLAFRSSRSCNNTKINYKISGLDIVEPVVYNPIFTKGVDCDLAALAMSRFNDIIKHSPVLRPGGSLCHFTGLDSEFAAIPAPSPDSNTGGKSSIDADGKALSAFPVHVDALTLTLPGCILGYDIALARNWLIRWSGGLFTIGGRLERRYNGYPECWQIVFADGGQAPMLGWLGVSWASDNMRGRWCFCLMGLASSCIRDWSILHRDCRVMSVRITRIDIAADDVEGVHPISEAISSYNSELFGLSGRMPSCRHISQSHDKGDTFYVGRRDSGKMLRVYEKGKQLGQSDSLWVRWELELKSKDRLIPFDVLIRPAYYLRGAYPDALSWLIVDFTTISTFKNQLKISFDVAMRFARRQVGKLVVFCREKKNMDFEQIVKSLSGLPGFYPVRLFDAGIV